MDGQLSQTSPIPSPSVSCWLGLNTVGQLSHASPIPSPSVSCWLGFGIVGQLSCESGIPSPSESGPTDSWRAVGVLNALKPFAAGAALKLEASKTADIDSRAMERATWSAQARVELFCCFFIELFRLNRLLRTRAWAPHASRPFLKAQSSVSPYKGKKS